jgi:hypothetical protein
MALYSLTRGNENVLLLRRGEQRAHGIDHLQRQAVTEGGWCERAAGDTPTCGYWVLDSSGCTGARELACLGACTSASIVPALTNKQN